MKKTFTYSQIFAGQFRLMVFYLFMMVCGFVFGTRLWTYIELPAVFSGDLSAYSFADIFLIMYAPAAAVTVIMLLLAISAVGWLIAPIINYALGSAVAIIICDLIKGAALQQLSHRIIFSICCVSVLLIISFLAVQTHSLSKWLAKGGANGARAAYSSYFRNTATAALVSVVCCAAFAAIIYLQTFLV